MKRSAEVPTGASGVPEFTAVVGVVAKLPPVTDPVPKLAAVAGGVAALASVAGGVAGLAAVETRVAKLVTVVGNVADTPACGEGDWVREEVGEVPSLAGGGELMTLDAGGLVDLRVAVSVPLQKLLN